MINEEFFPEKKASLSSRPVFQRSLLIVGGLTMLIVLNFCVVSFFADDLFFIHTKQQTVPLVLAERYETWTSRILLEALLLFFAHHLLLWRILNTGMMLCFACFIGHYTSRKRQVFHTYLAILFFFAIPVNTLQTSGWMSTSVNYIWPITIALLGVFPIVSWYQKGKHTGSLVQMSANLALIFACNSEFVALFLFLILMGLLSYSFISEGKIPQLLIFPTLISYGSLLFAIHAPGSMARRLQEAKVNFNDFQHVSFLHKLDLGFSSTCYEFFLSTNLLSLFFFALLVVGVFRHQTSHVIRFSAFMPAAILIGSVIQRLVSHWGTQSMMERTLKSANTHLFPFDEIFFTLLFLSTLWALIHSVASLKRGLFLGFLFFTGVLLRTIVGFTPAIWTSDFRSFFLFYVCLLYLSLVIYQEIVALPYTKYLVLFFNLASLLTFFSSL